jgi:hypothetical protein
MILEFCKSLLGKYWKVKTQGVRNFVVRDLDDFIGQSSFERNLDSFCNTSWKFINNSELGIANC